MRDVRKSEKKRKEKKQLTSENKKQLQNSQEVRIQTRF